MRNTAGRVMLAATLVLTALTASIVADALPASAAATDCKSSSYGCTPGYSADNTKGTWAWSHYGDISGNDITSSQTGLNHNCTLYAAWRLWQSGLTIDPGNWGNASNWAAAIGGGNHTPAVGSIAWYAGTTGNSAGHVAYVEQVSGSNVYIRADNYNPGNGYTSAGWVAASSVGLFLHPHDGTRGPAGLWWTASGDIPITGNWDGAGGDDVGVVRGNYFIEGLQNSSGGVSQYKVLQFGAGIASGDIPITGDWNGDSRTDIGVVRGNYFIEGLQNSSGGVSQYEVLQFGAGIASGDIPITGDWNGDSRTDIGVVRGNYFIEGLQNSSGGVTQYKSLQFGAGIYSGDIPIVGNWDGAGGDDVGVLRGNYFIEGLQNSSGGVSQYKSLQFGAGIYSGDIPVVGNWDHYAGDDVGVLRGNYFIEGLQNSSGGVSQYKSLQFGAGSSAHL